jgi:hypothetical protein
MNGAWRIVRVLRCAAYPNMFRKLRNHLNATSPELPFFPRLLAEWRGLKLFPSAWRRGTASLLLSRPKGGPGTAEDGMVDRVVVVYASDAAGLQENVNSFLRRNHGIKIVNIVQSQCLSRSEPGADAFVHVFLTVHYQLRED